MTDINAHTSVEISFYKLDIYQDDTYVIAAFELYFWKYLFYLFSMYFQARNTSECLNSNNVSY